MTIPLQSASLYDGQKDYVWTRLADSEKRIQTLETKCLRKVLHISDIEHKTNDWVQSKVNFLCGSTGTSSGNRQETETCMVRARHASP